MIWLFDYTTPNNEHRRLRVHRVPNALNWSLAGQLARDLEAKGNKVTRIEVLRSSTHAKEA